MEGTTQSQLQDGEIPAPAKIKIPGNRAQPALCLRKGSDMLVLQDSEAEFHPNGTVYRNGGDNFPPLFSTLRGGKLLVTGRKRPPLHFLQLDSGKTNTSFCQFMKTNSDAVKCPPEFTVVGNCANSCSGNQPLQQDLERTGGDLLTRCLTGSCAQRPL